MQTLSRPFLFAMIVSGRERCSCHCCSQHTLRFETQQEFCVIKPPGRTKQNAAAVQPMLCQYNSAYFTHLNTVDSTQCCLCMHKILGYNAPIIRTQRHASLLDKMQSLVNTSYHTFSRYKQQRGRLLLYHPCPGRHVLSSHL